MNVLGLSLSHCATACLLQEGEITACISEERLNRKKNCLGFPELAVSFLVEQAGLHFKDIDLVVLHSRSPLAIETKQDCEFRDSLYEWTAELIYRLPVMRPFYDVTYNLLVQSLVHTRWKRKLLNNISRKLGISEVRIVSMDHHLAHAYAPLYGLLSSRERENNKYLVLTNDGNGDEYCAAVNVFEKNCLSPIGKVTPNTSSLALVYLQITALLGMKPLEHEYKVMGLAPYADGVGVWRSYEVLKNLIWLEDDLAFHSKVYSQSYYHWLKEHLERHRFDWIAGAAQKLVEELLTAWVRMAVQRAGIRRIVCAGGIFMNVKANSAIAKIPEVEEVCFMPSASDESTAIGAAYYGYLKLCEEKGFTPKIKPLRDLYLGPEFSEAEIVRVLEKSSCFGKFKVERVEGVEKKVAKLLAQNKIVARFAGRMEWGARALGNRSILANPSNSDVVRVLNEQIKCRDFWMPFAGTILYEQQKDYIINPKDIKAPFMILAFDTTYKARRGLKAALHPYDSTMRPQILREKDNPSFYQIIKEFEKLTGIGGVLNTSFNIHGDPIVCSPDDAVFTFENSGLQYLALGNYLLEKRTG